MRWLSLLIVVLLMISTLGGCYKDEIPDNSQPIVAENYVDLMPVQKQEIKKLYNGNKDLLHKIYELICTNDYIINIQSDGYIVCNDGSKKWIDGISQEIKELHNIESKGYQRIGFNLRKEDSQCSILETYYSKTQTVYTILYSSVDLTQSDEAGEYTKLDDGWFLRETPMN